MKTRAFFLPFILVSAPYLALAQTPAGYPPLPNSAPNSSSSFAYPVSKPMPATPVPDAIVKQAEAQAQGDFSTLERSSIGGQIQPAWDRAAPDAGVLELEFCGACSYKIALRQYMVTVIEFPDSETIETIDVADNKSFDVQQRGPRRIVAMPKGYGVDANLIVYGASGTVYPIYVRAESFNSKNITDLYVRIKGATIARETEVAAITTHAPAPAGTIDPPQTGDENSATIPPLTGDEKSAIDGLKTPDPNRAEGDFVQEAPFDADKLRGWGDYKLWAGGPDGERLRPETVFKDDYFTYIRFGDNWKSIELPTAYVVVDGIDELVNTRVQGSTFIVESTQRLITLKSGKSFMCIEYGGAL